MFINMDGLYALTKAISASMQEDNECDEYAVCNWLTVRKEDAHIKRGIKNALIFLMHNTILLFTV